MIIFNTILSVINNVLMTLIGIAFTIQVFYVLLFFIKEKKFPEAKTQHRFAVIVPARNESQVIGNTVKHLMQLNYPKDKYDVFVIADNCTDNTAEIARNAGATVFEHFDDDPNHKRVGYALQYAFDIILKDYDNYDAIVRFDADNLCNADYLKYMNDAFDSGVKLARGYNNSKNLTQNIVSGVSGLWYIRDCRFSAHGRKLIGCGQLLVGSGMMVSMDLIREDGGWNCLSIVEDQEFSIKQLYKGYKADYVSDAIVYDDQPTTIKDNINRHIRIGNGVNKLFWTDGLKCFGKFFTTFEYTYLDVFLTLLFIPMAVVMCTWLPAYYIYDIVYNIIVGNMAHVWFVLRVVVLALVFAFIVPFILQAWLVAVLEKKKIGRENCKHLVPTILSFPLFMIIYALGITIGVFSKPKWKQVKRNDCVIIDQENLDGRKDETVNADMVAETTETLEESNGDTQTVVNVVEETNDSSEESKDAIEQLEKIAEDNNQDQSNVG